MQTLLDNATEFSMLWTDEEIVDTLLMPDEDEGGEQGNTSDEKSGQGVKPVEPRDPESEEEETN